MEPDPRGLTPAPAREYTAQDVCLAIPCFNAAVSLGQVLEAVARLQPGPAEVLIIDDGSQDQTNRIARDCGVRVIEHGQNRGLAAARNTAVSSTSLPLILFLDSDCVPHEGVLAALLCGLEDGDTAGVGGQEVSSGPTPTLHDRWRLAFRPQSHGQYPREDVWMLPGLCALYRRNALLETGGFDEHFSRNGEDVDMGIRLRKKGWRLAYRPSATVAHLRADSFGSLARLCFAHAYSGAHALRWNGEPAWHLLRGQPRWLVVSTVSSLLRHGSIRLALESPVLGVLGMVGTILGAMFRRS